MKHKAPLTKRFLIFMSSELVLRSGNATKTHDTRNSINPPVEAGALHVRKYIQVREADTDNGPELEPKQHLATCCDAEREKLMQSAEDSCSTPL